MVEELKACPFCGREAHFEHLENTRWSVGCIDPEGECIGFMVYRSYPRQTDAAKAWNTRTLPKGSVEKLRLAIRNAILMGNNNITQAALAALGMKEEGV